MIEYTVKRLLEAIGTDSGEMDERLLHEAIRGVSTDTRTLKRGEVFFAVKGDRFDGADYVGEAFEKGALLAVVNEDSMTRNHRETPVVAVKDTVKALGDAAGDYRSLFDGTVAAVTGTTGKTTAKEMMLAVLRRRFRVHGTPGNLNNHIGVPLSVFGLRRGHECAVFELGMSGPGEIGYLAAMVRPDIGVLLNVGPAHMEFFPNLEAVADAKMELLGALPGNAVAVINGDDALLRPARERCGCRIVTFGVENPADYRARGVTVGADGCPSFEVEGLRISLMVPGVHNVYNALAAYAVGAVMGVDPALSAAALEEFTAPGMRMQVVESHGVRYINDSYNANPMSMRCAAEVLDDVRVRKGGRKIAVLGDMLELGESAGDAHLSVGRMFGGLGLSRLFLVGEHADDYRRGAVDAGMEPERIECFPDSEAAARFIDGFKRPGDVILVKGSRGMRMEKIVHT